MNNSPTLRQDATLARMNFQVPFGRTTHEAFHLHFAGSPTTSDVLETVLALVRLLESRGIHDVQIASQPYSAVAKAIRGEEDHRGNPVQFSLIVPVADHDNAKNALYMARGHSPADIYRIAAGKSPSTGRRITTNLREALQLPHPAHRTGRSYLGHAVAVP